MVNPPVIDSSYAQTKKKRGIDKNALWRWKKTVPPIVSGLISIVLRKEMNLFGYQELKIE